ncbi:carbon-nitrogen hydrolase family protein [Nocardia sp. CA-119907]|uniref:carbon-nitrogen hydrolase family protein n=1 Tax=Nocardia sp. CA-119907 TaxID=3239973 RepID=UPI003D9751F2
MTIATVRAAVVQAEPKWLDLQAGIGQIVDLAAEAADCWAQIIAFPETFVPGYPVWIWLDSPAWGMQMVPAYTANSMSRDGAEMARVAAAAAEHDITIVFGFSERAGGSLYMAQAVVTPAGDVHVRRKLKPTHVERSVFGEGDGSDIAVFDTPLGRVGALNCWEHIQPLTKYAMYSQGEQIHVGSWPSFSLYRGAVQALSAEVNNAASMMYAVEGQVFVLAPCSVIGQAGHDLFCDSEMKKQLLLQGGGFARIFGPEGSSLVEPLPETEEGILYADLDFSLIALAKAVADPVGHYARPDVFQLVFNRNPVKPVMTGHLPAHDADSGERVTPAADPTGAPTDDDRGAAGFPRMPRPETV